MWIHQPLLGLQCAFICQTALFFHKLQLNGKNTERIGLSCRDQKNMYVAHLSSYYSHWLEEYFFIDSSFLPRSNETWVVKDGVLFMFVHG